MSQTTYKRKTEIRKASAQHNRGDEGEMLEKPRHRNFSNYTPIILYNDYMFYNPSKVLNVNIDNSFLPELRDSIITIKIMGDWQHQLISAS